MSYISSLRALIGHRKFIHPAARILIENDLGEFLFIERLDNGKLGIPAGALEEGESIEECIRREVKEETGLELLSLELIGISTHPQRESVNYPNGDQIQYFTVEFYSNEYAGTPKADQIETKSVCFLPPAHLKELAENERHIMESLSFYRENKRPLLG